MLTEENIIMYECKAKMLYSNICFLKEHYKHENDSEIEKLNTELEQVFSILKNNK